MKEIVVDLQTDSQLRPASLQKTVDVDLESAASGETKGVNASKAANMIELPGLDIQVEGTNAETISRIR